MRVYPWILGIALIALLAGLSPIRAGGAKKSFKAEQKWAGKLMDNALTKHAPKVGYLTHQKAFDALWAAWGLKDKTPTIDFTKKIVFVQLATGGPNIPNTTYTLDDKGDLRALSFSTLIGGPGFGYSIEVLNRAGIKTWQGKAIQPEPVAD